MNFLKKTYLLYLLMCLMLPLQGQESITIAERTPEQEAHKQTDRLQQELNLNALQAKQIYEINLRYARERQISNTRGEAMERIKNKDAELQKVLNNDQYSQLQNRRFERRAKFQNNSNVNSPISSQPTNSPVMTRRYRNGYLNNSSNYMSSPRGQGPSSPRNSNSGRSAAPSSNRR